MQFAKETRARTRGAGESPRVLLASLRGLEQKTYRCGAYEFEDVIAEVDHVDLQCWRRDPNAGGRRLRHRVAQRFATRLGRPYQPYWDAEAIRIEARYNLFVFVPVFAHDLAALTRLFDWRERCDIAVCHLIELWSKDLRRYRPYLEGLRRFDLIYVNNPQVVEPLERMVERPCRYLAPAVDTIRFSPWPDPPERVIDYYSMGRRSEELHRELHKAARRDGRFYVYDSIRGFDVPEWREHRDLLAGFINRSRFFLTSPVEGKDDVLVPRFFEAAAGGAVLVGRSPGSAHFKEEFGWPDAVIELPDDAATAAEALCRLAQEQDRLEAASARNAVHSLKRHDWAHRWASLLADVGLSPLPGLTKRLARLERTAAFPGAKGGCADPGANGTGALGASHETVPVRQRRNT